MTIEEVIKKAEEGGYVALAKPFCQECGNYEPIESKFISIFLDPKFWQALGKAMGWTHIHSEFCECPGFVWLEKWHLFIDHLAEGKTADSFFQSLN